jgi:hypothetical protein
LIYIFSLVVLICFIYGIRKYNTIFNPLSVNVVIHGSFFTGLSYISTITLRRDSINFPIYYLDLTVAFSTVALLSFALPFILKANIAARYINKALDNISSNENASLPLSKFGFIFLSLVFLGAFFSLVLFTSGGSLWITNPREAYLHHRAGFGIYFAFYLYSLIILFLYTLYMRRPSFWGLLFITAIFFFLSLFSGQKSISMIIIIIASCYYNFNVKNVSLRSAIFFSLVVIFIMSMLIHKGAGTEERGFEVVLDYFNYADTTAEFLYRHEEFGYYFGKAFLTSFWVFVPRSLYPDKPFEYGTSLIHAIMYPGLAEEGHTAGVLMWISSYLDFGIAGVIISFGIQGLLSKIVFEWYLCHKDTLFSFVVMIQFTLFQIWIFLPAPFTFVMCLVILLISSIFRRRI